MAGGLTNFASLTSQQKIVWSRDVWQAARDQMFVKKFMGSGDNAVIQRITELTKTERGEQVIMHLVADLVEDGVIGDNEREGNEEAMQTFDQVIRIDQLRHANRHEGRMADQKSIIEFRGNSRDVLAYWMADRIDQMAFLTMSGVSYAKKNNGATRTGSDLQFLEFAADVAAPSAARRVRWDGTNKKIITGASGTSGNVTTADVPMWELFVQLKAYAKERYIRGVGGEGGEEAHAAEGVDDAD